MNTENQIGLNQIIRERVANRIQRGQMSATEAIGKLIEEGKASNDYIAYLGANNTRLSDVTFNANGHVQMLLPENGDQPAVYQIHDNAIGQLGEKFKVPTRYIRELAGGDEWQRQLAAKILNDHSSWSKKTRTLVRVVGDEVRGVLSDSYRRLNSQDIIMAFLETANRNGAQLSDGMLDATRVYMEVLMPETISIMTPKNGMVEMAFGARLSTSDYGDGALELRAFMMQGVCLNGMVRDSVMRTVHLGSRLPENIAISKRTYELDTKTQASAIRDLTSGIFSKDSIMQRGLEIQGASEMVVDMERELKSLGKGKLLKEEVTGVEKILMRNNPDDGVQGESTLWKLVQGITAHGRSLDPRREKDFQEIAGDLMNRVKLNK